MGDNICEDCCVVFENRIEWENHRCCHGPLEGDTFTTINRCERCNYKGDNLPHAEERLRLNE